MSSGPPTSTAPVRWIRQFSQVQINAVGVGVHRPQSVNLLPVFFPMSTPRPPAGACPLGEFGSDLVLYRPVLRTEIHSSMNLRSCRSAHLLSDTRQQRRCRPRRVEYQRFRSQAHQWSSLSALVWCLIRWKSLAFKSPHSAHMEPVWKKMSDHVVQAR